MVRLKYNKTIFIKKFTYDICSETSCQYIRYLVFNRQYKPWIQCLNPFLKLLMFSLLGSIQFWFFLMFLGGCYPDGVLPILFHCLLLLFHGSYLVFGLAGVIVFAQIGTGKYERSLAIKIRALPTYIFLSLNWQTSISRQNWLIHIQLLYSSLYFWSVSIWISENGWQRKQKAPYRFKSEQHKRLPLKYYISLSLVINNQTHDLLNQRTERQ